MENQNPPTINPSQAPSPVQTPPSTPEVVKKTSKFPKEIIILIIIFLLLILAAIVIFFREPILNIVAKPTPTPTVKIPPSPIPDPTADWIIYEGKGFSIKYPSTWMHGINGRPACADGVHFYPQTQATAEYTEPQKTCPPSDVIFITMANNPNNLSSEDFLSKDSPTATSSKIVIAGIDSIKSTDTIGASPSTMIIVPKDGKFYTINWVKGNDFISEDLFDQILSTFKFTDQN